MLIKFDLKDEILINNKCRLITDGPKRFFRLPLREGVAGRQAAERELGSVRQSYQADLTLLSTLKRNT